MDKLDNMSIMQKVALYQSFDAARHADLESFAHEYETMKLRISTLEADLDEERDNRRKWRQKADVLEQSVGRSQFALVLIDGDAYHFNRRFYGNVNDAGGAQAAHSLYTDVQRHLRANVRDFAAEMEVVAIVYFNKQVPARVLIKGDIIQRVSEFDEFLWSFTSSRSLFQVVDCGPGKERADTKIRDTYRFYLNNAQCKHIFLACCHDNGYAAELDKYRHDQTASNKTVLVKHGNTANQFYNLSLPFIDFGDTFEMRPIQNNRRIDTMPSPYTTRVARVPATDDDSSQASTEAPSNNAWPSVATSAVPLPVRTKTSTSLSASADTFEPKVSKGATGDPKQGIPVNRLGQRIDRKIAAPSSTELERFEDRIRDQKLCNVHHLTQAGCFAYNCRYDHTAIDQSMRHTLKYKARSIPCTAGSKCRKADCFYGHQCPWGNVNCTNVKCAFSRNGLHDIDDLEIAKFVPANA